ncbi:MAG: hypothetical protein ACP5US_03725 [Candidatus Kryptoniota bacterium]
MLFIIPVKAGAQLKMELLDRLCYGEANNILNYESADSLVKLPSALSKRKSPVLAAAASLIVPGMGELYAGRYDAGKYSTIAEISLWIIYGAIEAYSNQVRNDAMNYAHVFAGADINGKSGQFFVDIGNFLNTAEYNDKKIRDGDYQKVYSEPTYQWQWQSDADRQRFKGLRIKADQFLDYGRYTVAVIVFNHLFSALNAARISSNVNASFQSGPSHDPTMGSGVYLTLKAHI